MSELVPVLGGAHPDAPPPLDPPPDTCPACGGPPEPTWKSATGPNVSIRLGAIAYGTWACAGCREKLHALFEAWRTTTVREELARQAAAERDRERTRALADEELTAGRVVLPSDLDWGIRSPDDVFRSMLAGIEGIVRVETFGFGIHPCNPHAEGVIFVDGGHPAAILARFQRIMDFQASNPRYGMGRPYISVHPRDANGDPWPDYPDAVMVSA